MSKKDICSYNYDELKEEMLVIGEKAFRSKQIYEWLHVKLADDFDEMTNLSKALREKLKKNYEIRKVKMIDHQISKEDPTEKFLFELEDGNMVESVLMKYNYGNSVCISSQAGCRMGCRFCASTIGGLVRSLEPSEMLRQIYHIQKITGERVSNVVVMGTGEPLDNYDNFVKFIHMLSDEHGLNISQRNITASTCGIVPNMRRLAEEGLQITLALSLHGSSQEKRKKLMPVANKYDLSEVLDACDYYFDKTGRRITFEYSLVAGVNDQPDDIRELTTILKGRNCHLNLIPVNPIKERDFKKPDRKNALEFKNKLEKNGINVTIRRALILTEPVDSCVADTQPKARERQMKIYAMTDVGRRREVNQDYVYVTDRPIGPFPNLLTVADGMGGHKAGDFASSYTVNVLKDELKKTPMDKPEEILRSVVSIANHKLIEAASRDIKLEGMGTTLVAATVVGNTLYFANVGDSRLYLINDKIRQLSKDHSLVEEMVRLGGIKAEEARNHPDKNIITRAIGVKEDVEPDIYEYRLKKGDMILMCTDGLSNMVEDEDMFNIVKGSRDVVEAVQMLIEKANSNGGRDNIGVIVAEPLADEVSVW